MIILSLVSYSPSAIATSYCKATADIYRSKDLSKEELPVFTAHSKTHNKSFDRYYVSAENKLLLWRFSYVDAFKARETVVKMSMDGKKVSKSDLDMRSSPSRLAHAEVEVGSDVDKFVEALVFGKKRNIRSQFKVFAQQQRWQSHVGKKYWLRGYLEFEVIKDGDELAFHLRPTMGQFVVHRKAMKPVRVHPWFMPTRGLEAHKALKPFMDMLNATDIKHESLLLTAMRILQHPNYFLRGLRRAMDGAAFHLFAPYFLIYDMMLRGVSYKEYASFRSASLGFWVIYLLSELLFYTPSSMAFSDSMDPQDAWAQPLLSDEVMTDWYALTAQWSLEDEGVTVLWNGMPDNNFYDMYSKNVGLFVQNIKYAFWNTLSVIYGPPDDEDLGDFDIIHINTSGGRTLATVYVNREDPEVLYDFEGGGSLRMLPGDMGTFFKAMFPILRTVGCEGQSESCAIKNVVTTSHGMPGALQNILELYELPRVRSVSYACVSGESCRGMPAVSVRTLNKEDIRDHFLDGPQFIFLACSVAQGARGENAMRIFADFFQLEDKAGRVMAAKKIVHPIFSVVPLMDGKRNSEDPRTLISRVLSYKLTEEARSYNHWNALQILKGAFFFGPHVIRGLVTNMQKEESMFCDDKCVMDLDFRPSATGQQAHTYPMDE